MASKVNIPRGSELARLLGMYGKPVSDTAQELIVLELYR
jgi:hypothetical protein